MGRQIVHWITSSIHENSKLRTCGEHVVKRNSFWHSEQFLYSTCSPHVLQKEELLTKIYLYQKLIWPFTVWIYCSSDLKSFSRFFLTVGQNNFGNKLPLFLNNILAWQMIFESCRIDFELTMSHPLCITSITNLLFFGILANSFKRKWCVWNPGD